MIIEVSGETVELETRVCLGRCGRKFRCMKDSSAMFARAQCFEVCYDGNPPIHLRAHTKHQRKLPNVKRHLPDEKAARAFQDAVRRAKPYLQDIENNRLTIVNIAIEVCFSRDLPLMERKRRAGLSFKRFSTELGLNMTTIPSWVATKYAVIDRVGDLYEPKYYAVARSICSAAQAEDQNQRVKELYLDEIAKRKGSAVRGR